MDDYKEEIRERASSGTGYVYRGGDVKTIREELEDGRLPATEYPVYTFDTSQQTFPWETTEPDTAIVAGGVTDDLAATRRFRGSRGVALIMDPTDRFFPYGPIDYNYDYYNANPGVLPQVLSSTSGEVRDLNGDLYGVFADRPTATGGRSFSMEHTVDSGLPATSPRSRFADEREWAATGLEREAVGIRNRWVEGVVGILADGRGDLQEFYTTLFETMPVLADIYTIRVTGEPDGEVWDSASIVEAIGPGGEMRPSEVPSRFRNGGSP
jgi:hypothetical protein